jgi:hypothetical protein
MVEQKGTGTKTAPKGGGGTYDFDPKDFVKSFIDVVKTVFFKPKDFYQGMSTTGGFPSPLIFLAVCLGISAFLSAIIWGTVAGFFYFLIFGLIMSFIGAAILYFIAQQFFEGKGTYEGTYRVVAYAGVVSLVSWLAVIPVLGGLIAFLAFLYGFYLQFIGMEKVHKITQGQAIVTVLIAIAVYIILGILVPGGLFIGMR